MTYGATVGRSSRGRASSTSVSPLLRAYWAHQRDEVLGSLEALLTHRLGFNLSTATPLQRQLARLVDGDPRLEPTRPELVEAVGDASHLVGVRPREVTIVASIRSAKTMLAAAAAVRATQTIRCEHLKAGEIPRVYIVSLDLDLAQVAHQHLAGTVLASSVLRELLVGEPKADSLTLRHPSGRSIEICTVAGKRAGGSLISRWCAGVIFDEAPRMAGDGDAAVNYDEQRRVVLGRLLEGAQILSIGSPWAPFGPIFEQVQNSWRSPTPERVVVRAPGWAMNPEYWTPARIDALRTADPDAYRVDCAAEFAAPESALIPPDVLANATRTEGDLPPDPLRTYAAAMDAGTRGNAWTLILMSRHGDRRRVDVARQWVGSRNQPLAASEVLREIAAVAVRYRVAAVWCDQWSADPLTELAQQQGLTLLPRMTPARERWEQAARFRAELLEGRLEMHPDPVLREDVLRAKRTTTMQGARLDLPTAGDGRHCDYVPALMLASAQYVADKRPAAHERGTGAWYEAEAARMEQAADEAARRAKQKRRW
jgi:hypothetical protein